MWNFSTSLFISRYEYFPEFINPYVDCKSLDIFPSVVQVHLKQKRFFYTNINHIIFIHAI